MRTPLNGSIYRNAFCTVRYSDVRCALSLSAVAELLVFLASQPKCCQLRVQVVDNNDHPAIQHLMSTEPRHTAEHCARSSLFMAGHVYAFTAVLSSF